MVKIKEQEVVEKKSGLPETVMDIWAFLMLFVFPLTFHKAYHDIQQTKYTVVLVVCGVMLGVIILYQLLQGQPKKLLSEKPPFWKKWNLLDWSMFAFIVICIVSTLLASPYVFQAFFGNEGRYNGLILMAIYVMTYFAVSRNMVFKKKYMTWALVGLSLVCLLGITDYFGMDLLNFREHIKPDQRYTFYSTIGNINTYVVFCDILMALSALLFIMNDDGIGKNIFYIVTLLIGILALITSRSDSGYIAVGALFALAPLAAFRTRRGVRRYCLTVFLFLAGLMIVRWWDQSIENVVWLEAMYKTILYSKALLPAFIATGVLTAVLYILHIVKRTDSNALAPKAIWWVWLGILIAAAAGGTALLIKANTDPDWASARLGSLTNVLVITDSWGTFRGYIWKAALEEFGNLPLHHKLFGTGPDTFGIYMVNNRYTDMVFATGFFFDCAHNEYINVLYTLGITGIITFLGIRISAVVLLIKKAAGSHKAEMIALAYVVIVYCAQAVVNFETPIIGGLFWSLLAIAGCLIRENKATVIQEKKK